MTEKQENVIRSALSVDRGSVHFVAEQFDIAYIAHGHKVLVQYCDGGRGRQIEKGIRGTCRSWTTPDKVIMEVDRMAITEKYFKVCWHAQWGDQKCNRIA